MGGLPGRNDSSSRGISGEASGCEVHPKRRSIDVAVVGVGAASSRPLQRRPLQLDIPVKAGRGAVANHVTLGRVLYSYGRTMTAAVHL